jgi:hypothetical protein
MCVCFQIYSPEDEVTKPPKRWVALPWPVPVDKNSRHASGVNIGEEYIHLLWITVIRILRVR